MMASFHRPLAVVLGVATSSVITWQAIADNSLVGFPENYADGVHYGTVERGNITEELFASRGAIEAAKRGEPFPDGTVITLKLKTADFRTLTRRMSLAEPTQLAQTLFRNAKVLLAKETNGRTRFRLIGVGISELTEHRADAADLLDPLVAKRAAAERASDIARKKFGADAVMTGRSARTRNADR